ncbi:MAG: hypothetical protein ACLSG9_01015 [Eubacterium sp.]
MGIAQVLCQAGMYVPGEAVSPSGVSGNFYPFYQKRGRQHDHGQV